jgi:hypothetical protein
MPPPEKQKRQLARLCDLVAASLLPCIPALVTAPRLCLTDLPSLAPQEAETSPPRQLTREDERRLLLALSRVTPAVLQC